MAAIYDTEDLTDRGELIREDAEKIGTVDCDYCPKRHVAEYSHEGQHGQGSIFAVVCNDLTDYYTEERVTR